MCWPKWLARTLPGRGLRVPDDRESPLVQEHLRDGALPLGRFKGAFVLSGAEFFLAAIVGLIFIMAGAVALVRLAEVALSMGRLRFTRRGGP